MRNPCFTEEEWPMLRKMYLEDNLSIRQIAAFFGVSGGATQRALNLACVPMRPRIRAIAVRLEVAPWNPINKKYRKEEAVAKS